MKAERNKTHSQILVLQQIGAELAEKSKVLKNEIEILRTTADEKERCVFLWKRRKTLSKKLSISVGSYRSVPWCTLPK